MMLQTFYWGDRAIICIDCTFRSQIEILHVWFEIFRTNHCLRNQVLFGWFSYPGMQGTPFVFHHLGISVRIIWVFLVTAVFWRFFSKLIFALEKFNFPNICENISTMVGFLAKAINTDFVANLSSFQENFKWLKLARYRYTSWVLVSTLCSKKCDF